MSLTRISPSVKVLRPPEPLVLEIITSGRYSSSVWARNGSSQGSSEFAPSPSAFVHFGDIYHVPSTSVQDLGVYDVTLSRQQGSRSTNFIVIAPG